MTTIPATANLRPFLPSKNFSVSKAFYEALGFRLEWENEKMAIFEAGDVQFFVQDYYVEDWANNCMLNLVVDDVEAWARHIQAVGVLTKFENVKMTEPMPGPYGTILSLIDPAGVLWRIQQQSVKA